MNDQMKICLAECMVCVATTYIHIYLHMCCLLACLPACLPACLMLYAIPQLICASAHVANFSFLIVIHKLHYIVFAIVIQ